MPSSSPRRALRGSLVAVMTATAVLLTAFVQPTGASAATASPDNLASSPSGTEIPTLSWDRVPSATSYTVEVYKSSSFAVADRLGTATTVNRQWVPTFQLPMDTTIWWRVNARVGSTTSDWASANFDRAQVPAPTGLSPGEGTTFNQPEDSVRFSWDAVSRATSYTLEIGPDQSFTDPARVKTYNTGATAYSPNVLQAAGTYYWRVTAVLSAGINTPSSDTISYEVRNPTLATSPQSPANGSTVSIQDVVLDWNPVPGAAVYNLQVSTDRNFLTTTTTVQNIVGTRYSPPKTLNNDQYFWRVTPVNADAVATDWAEAPVWQFRRHWPEQPQLEYPADDSTVGDPFYFQWTPVTLASRYELQLSTSRSFAAATICKTVHTTLVPENRNCWPQAEGSYYWRVLAYDDHASASVVPVSELINAEVGHFTYSPERVQPSSPADGAEVTVPTVSWQPYANAANYKVTVTSSGGATTSWVTMSTSFTPTSKLAAGTYRWDVLPIFADDRQGAPLLLSSQRTFTVVDPAPATAPTPEVNAAPLSSARLPNLTWSPVANATEYQLFVRRQGNSGWIKESTTFAYPAGNITDPQFMDPGVYEWFVAVSRTTSIPPVLAESSEPGTFTIAPFDPITGHQAALKGTDLDDPEKRCVAALPQGCQNLRQTPVLRWDAQPNAAGYLLYLSYDNQLTNPYMAPLRVSTNSWMSASAMPDSQAGTAYYWEAVPCTSDLTCAPATAPQHMFNKESNPVRLLDPVSPTDPDTHEVVGDWIERSNDVTFTWRDFLASEADESVANTSAKAPARTEARYYRVQTSTDVNFVALIDNVLVDQTTFTSFTKTLPEGPIYWRVQAVDGSLNPLNWSETGKFEKRSPAPSPTLPAAGSDVSGSTTFSWQSLAFAKTYNLEVYKNNDTLPNTANRVVSVSGLKQVAYTPTTPLPPSETNYRWRVQRVDASARVGAWSELRPFRVIGSQPLLMAPSSGTTVEPRGALFEWADATTTSAVSKYRWVAVNGTTRLTQDTSAKSYAPVARLADGSWQWTVTALDASGKELGTSSPRSFLVRGAPHATVTLEGSGQVGTPMSVAPVNWNPDGVTTTGYQWFRGTAPIAGATSRLYTLTTADFGKEVWVRVTGTKEGYDPGTADSPRTTPSEGQPLVVTQAPGVAGSNVVGQRLTATTGQWTPSGSTTYTYQWFRHGVAISGQTGSTYTVVAADAARNMKVKVTAKQTGLAPGTAYSPVLTIAKMASKTTTSLSARTIRAASRAKVSATITAPSGAVITGPVKIYDRTKVLSTVTLTAAAGGKLTVLLPKLARGQHYISVQYVGNTQITTSRAPRMSLVVTN